MLFVTAKGNISTTGCYTKMSDDFQMLFFGSHCERLCMMQFSLISLIPNLIRHLQDCADPAFNSYEEDYVRPTSLRTSDRTSCKLYRIQKHTRMLTESSVLAYMGLPLQIFGKVHRFLPAHTNHSLNHSIGQPIRSLHAATATRYVGRSRHEVICRRVYKFIVASAKG
jgi:hypothetical protein